MASGSSACAELSESSVELELATHAHGQHTAQAQVPERLIVLILVTLGHSRIDDNVDPLRVRIARPERLAQTIVEVAGRAGRGRKPGEVLIQTEFPGHPLLLRLLAEAYDGFARAALAERAQAS
jgi:hypothetical protein